MGINEEKGFLVVKRLGRTDVFMSVKVTVKFELSCYPEAVFPFFYITADFHSSHSFSCPEQLHLSIISIKNIFERKSKPSIC